jgi:hydroxymethylpyrimidine kinase / phosphomethylpyrimidine kinase / thiamine-phosphate diphosphorylase
LGTEIAPLAEDQRPVVWSIAESDSGGGVSLQADLKALQVFGVHGCLVAAYSNAEQLDAQLAALANDLPPHTIKTGLLGGVDNVRVVCQWVDRLRGQGLPVALVVDPVLGSITGASFASDAVVQAYVQELLPRATLVTLNRADAARLLTAMGLEASLAVPAAAAALAGLGQGKVSVVITDGGTPAHNVAGSDGLAADWLHCPQASGWLSLPRLDTPPHHSTRCTFASTAAAALASGYCVADAVVLAKMATNQGQFDFAQHVANLPTFTLPGAKAPLDVRAVQPFARLSNPALGVYAVVDSADWVRRVLAYGIRTVQLRIKDPAQPTLAAQIAESIAVARATPGAQLFINDHWQLALQHGAYGVHLGQEDLEHVDLGALQQAGVRLGLSTHSYWEVARAWALRPSYIACGPIFATQSKDMPWIPQGLDNLRYWAGVLPLPVVGIAGIDVHNMAAVAATGAASGAVISAITKAVDPAKACADLMAAFAR